MKDSAFAQYAADAIKIVQLTDTHLFAEPSRTFDGVDTEVSLQRVIDLACENHWPPDLVLATGDLAHEPLVGAYTRLRSLFNGLAVPVYCIPGNHDDPTVMGEALPSPGVHLTGSARRGRWQFVFLNTVLRNADGGHLPASELQRLDKALWAEPDLYALICLHHPPVMIGSRWMDAIALDNPDEFFAVLDRHAQVKAVVWGHIHQEFAAERNGVHLFGSPSTCVQFRPRSDEYRADTAPAGYRWLVLKKDGTIETGILRLGPEGASAGGSTPRA
ncbi:MAG: phosphodiesterase [Gammaproteobacteria bacterium]|nr:phosphodiesterase [Gammaproteobacteria bacterium]MCI0590171.1 phosphodiesterase [Gammaproteobacteria bacterium]